MTTNQSWKLKRFARYTPGAKDKPAIPWKVHESGGKKSPVFLTILDSGYLLVMQGQESLCLSNGTLAEDIVILLHQFAKPDNIQDTMHLVSWKDNIKVHQKSDNLLFRFTLKGESRMTRLQFDGKNKEEALKECSSALKKVMEYLPVTTVEDTPQPSNHIQNEISVQVTQPGTDIEREHKPVQGLLPIKKLAQHFLGDTTLTLPEVYHHSHLAQGDFEPILRVFLLDPSFHAFVEKLEGELKKLLQE